MTSMSRKLCQDLLSAGIYAPSELGTAEVNYNGHYRPKANVQIAVQFMFCRMPNNLTNLTI